MKIKLRILIIMSLVFALTSCDVLLQSAGVLLDADKPLTTEDVAMGLKEALEVGTDTAVAKLTVIDGYYLDEAVKIGLPEQVNEVLEHARKVPGIDRLIEDVVLQINRSAEDAARQAAPVFKEAISQMSIVDAWNILNGEDNAATLYLKANTGDKLTELYMPVMRESLNKPIAGNVSAQSTWDNLTSKWNLFANSFAGKLAGVSPVKLELDEYVTQKALDGLFLKVANQEANIRNNAGSRVTSLLKRVFDKSQQSASKP